MKKGTTKIEDIAAMLRVLGHPDRLKILACLTNHECFVNDLALKLNLPQSTVSQHLRAMTDKGILISARDGVKVRYKPSGDVAKTIAKLVSVECEINKKRA